MKKNLLTIVIIFLFAMSTLIPNVIGHNSTIFKKNKFLDDLNFMNSRNFINSKFDNFKKYLLSNLLDDDVVESEEIITPVESQSTIILSRWSYG